MLALVVGTLLAIGALLYVLFPLFLQDAPRAPRAARITGPGKTSESDAVVALREIEFDRVTGKLSDADYEELKARYMVRAVAAMRRGDAPASSADPVEAAVIAFRARMKECATCGPRPEPDAIYCSNCGRYLPGSCASCGSAVEESAAAFCASCGSDLAA